MSTLATTKTIAEHFGVHPETVRKWVRKGVIPYLRPTERTIRFDMNEVEEALASPSSEQNHRKDVYREVTKTETP